MSLDVPAQGVELPSDLGRHKLAAEFASSQDAQKRPVSDAPTAGNYSDRNPFAKEYLPNTEIGQGDKSFADDPVVKAISDPYKRQRRFPDVKP
jgi:hypothetical protein